MILIDDIPEVTFSDIVDIVSLIAGMITIIGATGIVSWSFSTPHITSVSGTIQNIFVYAIKIWLCIILLTALLPFASILFFLAAEFGSQVLSASTMIARIIGYIFSGIVFLPIAALTCSSIFSWSLKPFERFIERFTGKAGP